MLKINELNKSYGKKVALIDFTAEFVRGLYGLLGPNGAGKSTFMNILAGVIKSNSGDIFYNDINIKELKAKFKEKNLRRLWLGK
jgi:ABC-2 type transport system ATP-binding protein